MTGRAVNVGALTTKASRTGFTPALLLLLLLLLREYPPRSLSPHSL